MKRQEMNTAKPAEKLPVVREELSDEELDGVSGGLNPQPLPPRYFLFYLYRPIYLVR